MKSGTADPMQTPSETPPPSPSRILAAALDSSALVVVSGKGDFRLAPAFRQALQAVRLSGCTVVAVDMASCRSLDSTFMGAIASAAQAYRKPGSPALHFLNLNDHVRHLLRGLGVDRLMSIAAPGDFPPGLSDLSPLTAALAPVEATTPAGDLSAILYDTHETLARLSPENREKFRDVLACLARELPPS